jgi:tripartite-type tricarboxylate transporter receptor subunit TctC
MKGFIAATAAACLTILSIPAWAQAWPSKPVRLVIPYAAGGGGDVTWRSISNSVEGRLGQRFVVDNKVGASGNLGAADVARAQPDGYTLLLASTNNLVTNQFLFKDMGFDPLQAFAPIAMLSDAPTVFAVNASVPARTLPELVAHAKANPGKLNFGSPGNATPPHLAAELLARLANVKIVHIPYKGAAGAVQALLAGDIQLYFTALTPISGHMKSGKVRALAVGSQKRLQSIPDVPTTAEAGFPELLTGNWWVLAAPRGIDAAIVDRLAAEVRTALAETGVQNRYVELGMIRGEQSPQELRQWLQSEAARWKRIIEAAGVKAE